MVGMELDLALIVRQLPVETAYVRGQPWHEMDRATHLVEHSSVDFNEGDIDIYNRYINHVQRNKKTK
jgi:hypothetical protein